MVALLIAEVKVHKQAPSSKLVNSNKARKHRTRKKANPDEQNTGSKGHDEKGQNTSNVASGSGTRDNVGDRDDMGRNALHHSEPDGEMDTHRGEENAGPVLNNDGQGHNEPQGGIVRNVQQIEASIVECETGTSHSGLKEPTTTQAERRQQKKRERKGRQRQRKRATTQLTLEEALAQVDTVGASLDTLNALDVAIVCVKRILEHGGASSSTDAPLMSSASSDLPELLRQARRGEVAELEERGACSSEGCRL
jgi:hypothetical protein